jgi:UDP-glucuronate 4-epimerase
VAILLTGVAGFIGMHLARHLLEQGQHVVGIDSLNNYYDVGLKKSRVSLLSSYPNFKFIHLDLIDGNALDALFESNAIATVVHLAAQTGVRYSTQNPHAYIMSNIVGFANIAESCRRHRVSHLIYASSSSVYGANRRMPFSEHHCTDHPVSLYAATKKSNELIAHAYSHLYRLPTTGLRFFTVYGPWGRPDMAPMLFADAILNGKPIEVFNHGEMLRDFTYIGDVIESIARLIYRPAKPNPDFDALNPEPATSHAPYRVYNIGNQRPVKLMDFIEALERELGKTAEKIFSPMQAGDVVATYADTRELAEAIQWIPSTPLEVGVAQFLEWFRHYYRHG